MTLSDRELARILGGLALLLHSGITAADGAYLLAREAEPDLETLLNSLGQRLDRGSALSEAVETLDVFPNHVRAMIRIGEETGRLEEALQSLGGYYEGRIRVRRQIRAAVAYPAMVLALMLLVIGVLLVKVLPVFDRVYASLGSSLTGPAAGLLYAGRLLEAALPALLGGLLALAAGAVVLRWCPAARQVLSGFFRRRFGDRGLAREFNNARFAEALAMGMASGMAPEESLSLAADLLGDTHGGAARCAQCARAMEAGVSLCDAMEAAKLLPPAQCRLLQIGLRGGNGDQVMGRIADTMREEAQNALERRISAIEPAMVLASSVLVGVILLSVMLPLADILSVLG